MKIILEFIIRVIVMVIICCIGIYTYKSLPTSYSFLVGWTVGCIAMCVDRCIELLMKKED